jgi:hypothetical protein
MAPSSEQQRNVNVAALLDPIATPSKIEVVSKTIMAPFTKQKDHARILSDRT